MRKLKITWENIAYIIALTFLVFSNEIEHGLGLLIPFRKVFLYIATNGLFIVAMLIKKQTRLPRSTTLNVLSIQYYYYIIVTLISCFCRQNQSVVANLVALQFSLVGFILGWQMEREKRSAAEILLKRVAAIIVIQILVLYGFNLNAGYDHNTFKPHIIIPVGKSNAIASILLVCMCSMLPKKENIIAATVCFIGIIMTLSNSGVVSACVSLALIMVCQGILSKETVTKIFAVGLSAIPLISALSRTAMWSRVEIYLSRFTRTIGVLLSDTSSAVQKTNGRSFLWNNAITVFSEHPIIGVGVGDYVLENGDVLGKTHNVILQTSVWGGMIGTMLFGALIYSIVRGNTGKRKQLLMCSVAGVLIQAMVEPTFFTPGFDFFFWLYVGSQKCALMEDEKDAIR